MLPLLLLAGYYGLYLVLRGPLAEQPLIIAHRGDSAHHPENTMNAFKSAVATDAGWIEFDVQRSADGRLVVIHDETVDRTTDSSGRVVDLTFAELRALDAGGGQQIPSFEEVLAFAREAGVGAMPEAKSPQLYPGLEEDMLAAILAAGGPQGVYLQSFDHDLLERAVELDRRLAVCPLTGLWKFDLSAVRPESAALVCPMAEMAVLYPWMIRQAHAEGRQVLIWFGVIEHPLLMRLLLFLGADGLIVDDPGALAEILQR